MKDYDGKIVHVFKHFPLTQIHPWAMKAALASEAVYQLRPDLFWDIHDFFFKSQRELNASNIDSQIESFLASKKINIEDYKKKVASSEVQKAVDADVKEAGAVGVNSTPTFFVNGRRVGGALQPAEFKRNFDDAFADLSASASK